MQAFIQLSCEVSYAKLLLTDDKSQIGNSCDTMKLNIVDAKCKLSKDVRVDFEVSPVGEHSMHEKVERKI